MSMWWTDPDCCVFVWTAQCWMCNGLSPPASLLSLLGWSSASCPPSLLHPPSWQRDHARGERQHHLCGSRLPYAVRKVDAGCRRPDARGWHAHRPQRPGADWCASVQQLHVCGHVNAWCDRGCGTDHCERWVYLCVNEAYYLRSDICRYRWIFVICILMHDSKS